MPKPIQISYASPTLVPPEDTPSPFRASSSHSHSHSASHSQHGQQPEAGPSNPYSGVSPSPGLVSTSDDHARALRRIFIGQMPASVVLPAAAQAGKIWNFTRRGRGKSRAESGMSEDDDLQDEERRRLRDRFIRRGGTQEAWEGEMGARFLDRWAFLTGEASGREWRDRGRKGEGKGKGKKGKEKREWVGRTFEVGKEFWEVVEEELEARDREREQEGKHREGEDAGLKTLRVEPTTSDKVLERADERESHVGRVSQKAAELYADPPEELYPPISADTHTVESTSTPKPAVPSLPPDQVVPPTITVDPPSTTKAPVPASPTAPRASEETALQTAESISSTRPLLGVPGTTPAEPAGSSKPTDAASSGRLRTLRSALSTGRKGRKSIGKNVTFPPTPPPDAQGSSAPSGAGEPPAPPHEVLARRGSSVEGTSAGASVAAAPSLAAEEDEFSLDVVMRDRMLLRALYTRSEDIPRRYDEEEARRHPDARGEDWAERLVVWRGGERKRVEIYEDHTLPGASKLKGHQRLAFVIPLQLPTTSLSLYSATDLTFCLTCAPFPADSLRSRAKFHLASSGTNIFIFKPKSRTRALDWMWKLWRFLGGHFPRHVDVQVPALDTRVRIFVPQLDPLSLTRKEVLETCLESLLSVPEYQALMEPTLRAGGKAELCWRSELKLDWLWLSVDVEGRPRAWEVLNGLALRQARKATHLELRLAEHYPTKTILADGTTLSEPPAVEGYLHLYTVVASRVNRRRVYVATNDGNLMFMPQHRVRPPAPPTLPPEGQTDEQRKRAWATFRAEDTARQGENVLVTEEYVDLRDVLIIRWAEGVNPPKTEEVSKESGNIPDVHEGWEHELYRERTEDLDLPNGDAGGGQGEGGSTKAHLRVQRSFELVMRSGQVIRLEAHARRNASEWIHHLKALVSYWTRQHRVWARFEMDLTYGVDEHRDGVLKPRSSVGWYPRPKEPVDPDAGSSLLPGYWHWCVLDGCRAIIKSGRLYQKTGYRKQYTHMYHILVQGHLLQFKLTSSTNVAYRLVNSIPLSDAYVYSGQSATSTMPQSRDEQQGRYITRYYQDGFEARDSDEDTTFVIWYRDTGAPSRPIPKPPENALASAHVGEGEPPQAGQIPSLGEKNKLLICRARSRLERDTWCWALNVEIERLVRAAVGRERALREDGEIQRA